MFRYVTIALISGLAMLAGCSSQIPKDFQVSGKPIGHWLTGIRDPDSQLRLKAVRALGNVGPHHPQAIPALIEALRDREASIRSQAALALLKSGPNAESAVPALQAAVQDPDPSVRQSAGQALAKIAG